MKKKLLSISALLLGGMAFGQTTILLEDFESGIPVTWSQVTSATDGGYLAGTASSLSSGNWAISTSNSSDIVVTNDDNCNCDKNLDRLISPSMNFSAATAPRLSVDIFFNRGTYQNKTEKAYIDISTDNGVTWTNLSGTTGLSGAADWRTVLLDLTAYAGQSNVKISFRYTDATGWLFGLGVDNFHAYQPAPVDVELTSLNIQDYYFGAATIAGTITNYGTSNITSVDIDWNDGTAHNQTLSVNIAPLASYNFTHGTTLNTVAGNTHPFTVTATVASDAISTNNSLSHTVYGLSFLPTTKVVGEEGTGTWCGWCPRGAVFMDQMAADFPNTWIGVAVHNGDPMTVSAYDNAIGNLISGYPSGVVDRIPEFDPSDFPNVYDDRILINRPASVSVSNTWNPTTRALGVTVTADFAATLTGINWRLAAIVIEDDVTGTTSQYNQTNYYAGGGQGAMGGFENLPDPVPAAQMVYNHVGRAILGGFNGQSGSIPANITIGGNASYTFTYTAPATHDETKYKVVGIIIDQTSGQIVNANEIDAVLGLTEANDAFEFSLYPNPADDLATIKLNIKEEGDVTIDIYNVAGTLVNSNNYGSLNGMQNFQLNSANYEAGVYFVNVRVNGSVLSKKMIITH